MRGTQRAFREWLRKARRGDRYTYYIGHLAVDRGPESRDARTEEQQAVTLLAAEVFAAHARGAVTLAQSRLNDDFFVYYAIKR